MRCGRHRCSTPHDDVRQFKMVTLCRAHRLALHLPTLGETEKRLGTLRALKEKAAELRTQERETVGTGVTRKAKTRK